VITDKGIVTCGLIEKLKQHLSQFEYSIFDDIEETPSLETIRKCVKYAKEGKFDLLVGFGGGSPMDATKAVSITMTHAGDIADLLGRDTVKVPGLKTILVPTTSGTGSEVTLYSILTERNGSKNILTGIADRHLLPEWAIVDPTLTISMPSSLTANTGIDAISHAMESYLNIHSNFQSEPLALKAIELLSSNLERATADGTDSEARYNMSAGSVLAGMSLCQTGGGLAHALAETIQIPYNLPHGAAIAVILPHVMSYNLVAEPNKYATVAKAMGIDPTDLSQSDLAGKSVGRINQIIEHVGLPQRLSAFDIPEADLEEIAKLVSVVAPGLLKVNPRSTSEKDLLELLRKAY
jgi:alcohol dehydrogenase